MIALANLDIRPGFCGCGCGAQTQSAPHNNRSKGWVKGEPLPFRRGHNMRKSVEERLNKYRVAPNGCWEWLGDTCPRGYGHFFITRNGKRVYWIAHRFFYEHHIGAIPEGKQLDHLCRNPSCVNPAHLEPVTGRENSRRGRQTKLTITEVRAICASTELSTVLAARYGIHRDYAQRLRTGRAGTWTEVCA